MTVKPRPFLWSAIKEIFGSQRAFAQAVGEDPSIVSRAITGRLNLDESTQKRWARALGRNVAELFRDAA